MLLKSAIHVHVTKIILRLGISAWLLVLLIMWYLSLWIISAYKIFAFIIAQHVMSRIKSVCNARLEVGIIFTKENVSTNVLALHISQDRNVLIILRRWSVKITIIIFWFLKRERERWSNLIVFCRSRIFDWKWSRWVFLRRELNKSIWHFGVRFLWKQRNSFNQRNDCIVWHIISSTWRTVSRWSRVYYLDAIFQSVSN